MKQTSFLILSVIASVILFTSCKRMGNDAIYLSTLKVAPVHYITSDTLCGPLQGTLQPQKTYYVTCPVSVNAGDTLKIENGDTLYVTNPSAYIYVQGILLSLGTQAHPVWITVPGITKQDNVATAENPSSDPAFTATGQWCGIQCDTNCTFCVLKWTHLEYVGKTWATPPIAALSGASWPIYFSNPNGNLVFEDSWIYGTVDDGIRFAGGKICVMRSTFEKISYTSGDVLNAKHGTVGIMAYNLFVGGATNGTKMSDKGSGTAPTTHVDSYNNTFVNCGFRHVSAAHGANVDYEQNSYGQSYNNLIVNCWVGFRVVGGTTIADTTDCHYGYNYSYGDSTAYVDQFYPVGAVTDPEPTDIPNPANFLPAGYTIGAAYSAPQLAMANNPQFVNYPLPCPSGVAIDYVSGFDFHLQASSPAVSAGYTGFTPNNIVPIDSVFGVTSVSPPGKDIGCYQTDGSGNQH